MLRQLTLNSCKVWDRVRSIGDLSRQFRRQFSRFSALRVRANRTVAPHLHLGKRGERLAAKYLRSEHFRILYRNFRPKRGGEVDLVCRDKDVLVFVEVKTRSTEIFGAPHEAVTHDQQERIRRGAMEWLRLLNNLKVVYRFDIVEVLMESPPRINLIRGAFSIRDDV